MYSPPSRRKEWQCGAACLLSLPSGNTCTGIRMYPCVVSICFGTGWTNVFPKTCITAILKFPFAEIAGTGNRHSQCRTLQKRLRNERASVPQHFVPSIFLRNERKQSGPAGSGNRNHTETSIKTIMTTKRRTDYQVDEEALKRMMAGDVTALERTVPPEEEPETKVRLDLVRRNRRRKAVLPDSK